MSADRDAAGGSPNLEAPVADTERDGRGWRGRRSGEHRAPSQADVGAILADRFELLAHLGSGGMGTVYSAHDRQLDVDVAIKLLHPSLAGNDGAIEALRREVKLARRVTHANVARIHELVTDSGRWFLTMELIDGAALSDMVCGAARLPVARVIEVIASIGAGLEAVHQAGVVHGDIKPANVLVARDGRVVLSDFGIARFADAGSDSREVVGTPAYMAPEQVTGDVLTPQTDLYALGIVAFELLSGMLPFRGRNAIEIASARLIREAPSLASLCPAVPAPLAAAIQSALSREPGGRPQSAAAFCEQLIGVPQDDDRQAIESVDTVDLYLRAQWLYRQIERIDESVELFASARRAAPEAAVVAAGYAAALTRKWMLVGVDRSGLVAEAKASAAQAMKLAPHLGESHMAQGSLELHLGDPVAAAVSFRAAMARAPGLADGHSIACSMLFELGAIEEAERRGEVAQRLDSAMVQLDISRARARGLSGDWTFYDREIANKPGSGTLAMMMLSRLAAYRGDRDALARLSRLVPPEGETLHATVQLFDLLPRAFLGEIDLESVYAMLPFAAEKVSQRRLAVTMQMRGELACVGGDLEQGLIAIEVADKAGLIDWLWLERCPLLDPLRGQPRFSALRERVLARCEQVAEALGVALPALGTRSDQVDPSAP